MPYESMKLPQHDEPEGRDEADDVMRETMGDMMRAAANSRATSPNAAYWQIALQAVFNHWLARRYE